MAFLDSWRGKKNTYEDEEPQEGADGQDYQNGYDDYADNNYPQEGDGGYGAADSEVSATLEMKVVRPEDFTSATDIADHLLSGRTVVLNLEVASKDVAARLIDFLSGVVYSVHGNVRRVATNTYVITPDRVKISGDKAEGKQPSRRAAAAESDGFDL